MIHILIIVGSLIFFFLNLLDKGLAFYNLEKGLPQSITFDIARWVIPFQIALTFYLPLVPLRVCYLVLFMELIVLASDIVGKTASRIIQTINILFCLYMMYITSGMAVERIINYIY